MRLTAVLLGVLLLCLARPVFGAGTLELDAPGDMWYERDGSISARGTKTKPVTAVLNGYEITAAVFHYDPRRQIGEASGQVRWLEKRPGINRELNADTITFNMLKSELRAQGHITLADGELRLNAEAAQGDLRAASYQLTGAPAQAAFGQHLFRANQLRYDASRKSLDAVQAAWTYAEAGRTGTLTCGRLVYDLAALRGEAAHGVELSADGCRLTSAALNYDGTAQTFMLSGAPALTRGTVKLTAGIMTWRPAEGIFLASGGARLEDRELSGTCGELSLNTRDNQARLLGGVVIKRGGDVVSGDEILYDTATGRLRVAGRAIAHLAF